MNDPSRKIAMMAIVNSSLRRRSGVRKARPKALSTLSSWPAVAGSRVAGKAPARCVDVGQTTTVQPDRVGFYVAHVLRGTTFAPGNTQESTQGRPRSRAAG